MLMAIWPQIAYLSCVYQLAAPPPPGPAPAHLQRPAQQYLRGTAAQLLRDAAHDRLGQQAALAQRGIRRDRHAWREVKGVDVAYRPGFVSTP